VAIVQEPELRVSVEMKTQGWWEGNYLEEQAGSEGMVFTATCFKQQRTMVVVPP
jgi:hypothetical protein